MEYMKPIRNAVMGLILLGTGTALGSCGNSSEQIDDGYLLNQQQVDSIRQEVTEHNDYVLNLYGEKVQQDSVDMINAQKVMPTIDMRKLERDYNKASNMRKKAREELNTAKEDGKEHIAQDRQEKFNKVCQHTQATVDAYNKALETQQIAAGKVYNTNKARLEFLRNNKDLCNDNGRKIELYESMDHAVLSGRGFVHHSGALNGISYEESPLGDKELF